jgi:hypothetical protein
MLDGARIKGAESSSFKKATQSSCGARFFFYPA